MTIPAPGTLLAGRFRLDGTALGEGRMGTVVAAVDEATGRRVAVKLLHDHVAADRHAVERLEVESRALTTLRHPHAVEVIGLWADEGRWLLVSERVDGISLETAASTAMSASAVIALGLQLASALEAAHAAGIVHGDVRPGNVLVGPRGAFLYDFGSRVADPEPIRAGETAPELHAGAAPSVRSDLYGLGLVLYRGLAGAPAFAPGRPWAAIGAQQQRAPAPPGPRGLCDLVVALLDPDPAGRPADAVAVRRVLARLADRPDAGLRFTRAFAPLRLGGAWLVHGIDPATGGPAVIRADLRAARARQLVERLRGEGWEVRATRVGLGRGDLAWIALAALVGWFAIPFVGGPLGAVAAAYLLSQRCHPGIREALPPARAALPPVELARGSEYAVSAGLLMMLGALLLWLWPAAAAVPLGLCAVVLVAAIRAAPRDVAEDAGRARVETAIASVRRALGASALPLDDGLALQGELEAIERDWRGGSASTDDALSRSEDLSRRIAARPDHAEPVTRRTVDALRRAHAELDGGTPPDRRG